MVLKASVEELASRLSPVEIPGFALSELGDFVALRPKCAESALISLASACVSELDPFRAPATAAERQARQPERLSERQRDYLDRWGYPYVHDEFRFHMTLSDDMEAARRRRFRDEVDAIAGEVFARPVMLADLALVRQDTPNTPFVVVARFPLGG